MERVARGDVGALGELFVRRRPALFAFVFRLVRDEALAEDLVQEAFWRVWQHRASFDGRARLSTWLYVIARRLSLNEVKSAKHRTVRLSELSEEERRRVEACESTRGVPFLDATLAEDKPRAAEMRIQVQEALGELPVEQRAGVVLRQYEDRSYREIGAILGCSEGNARVLVHRARVFLRARLAPFVKDD